MTINYLTFFKIFFMLFFSDTQSSSTGNSVNNILQNCLYISLLKVLSFYFLFRSKFLSFSAFLKSDRENEEHVYADLIDVCSSNDQISGRLWNILDFCIFVFNLSIFFLFTKTISNRWCSSASWVPNSHAVSQQGLLSALRFCYP